MRNLTDDLLAFAKKTPYLHLPGYMNRWWIVPYKHEHVDMRCRPLWFRLFVKLCHRFDISIRIHEILSSDMDRHPHDHPWSCLSLILRGSYCEHYYTPNGKWERVEVRDPGDIVYRTADTLHRLTLNTDTVTTLFITWSKEQTWGFNVNGVKIPYKQYLGKRLIK